jgi:hypothetical protein
MYKNSMYCSIMPEDTVKYAKMSNLYLLLQKLLEANDLLARWHQAVDREWNILQQQHIKHTGDPLGYLPHLQEIAQQAHMIVGNDPTNTVFLVFDEVADAFLQVTPDERTDFSDFFADCRELMRIHLGYIGGRAVKGLRATGAVVWLYRGVAVAALGQGGTDIRELSLALNDLCIAAQAVGQDVRPVFNQVGTLASTKPGYGGLDGSIRDFLLQFTR